MQAFGPTPTLTKSANDCFYVCTSLFPLKQITIGYFSSARSLHYVERRLQAQVQIRFVPLISHFQTRPI